MRILVAAVGRLKDASERTLAARYLDGVEAVGRAVAIGPATCAEIPEGRARTASQRRDDEAARLLRIADTANRLAVLDLHGRAFTSMAFARWLGAERDAGVRTMAFLIGGPDGHGRAVREAAAFTLSLSIMTLPHGLARIVLAEQLYRAAAILAGHPYHRE